MTYGWAERDRGNQIDRRCLPCGRPLYVASKSTYLLCNGCGEQEDECLCPDARELVA